MSIDRERRYGTDLDSLRARASAPQRPVDDHDDPLAELERLVAENDAAIARNAQDYDHRRHEPYHDDRDLFREDADAHGNQAYYADDPRYAPNDHYYEDGYQAGAAEPSYDDDGQYEQQPEPRGRRSGLGLVAAVLVIAGVGGAAALGYSMLGGGDEVASGPPPVIEADSEPLKVAAESGSQTEVPHQNKMIYDRVGAQPNGNANVVGGAEEPVERPPASPPREVSRVILPGAADTNAASDPQAAADAPALQPLETENAAVAPEGESGGQAVVPADGGARRVRTFVIRPDGSMGEAEAPVATAAATASPASEEPAGPIVGEGVAEGMSMQPGDNFGIMSEGGNNAAGAIAESVPLPTARPAGLQTAFAASQPAQAAPSAPAQTTPAAAPRAQAPAPAAAAPAGSGYTVQVTSQRSEAEARQAYTNLQRRFPNILNGYQPTLQPVNIADRGTFYRVRVGSFGSQADASTLCGSLKSAGGDCIVQRN